MDRQLTFEILLYLNIFFTSFFLFIEALFLFIKYFYVHNFGKFSPPQANCLHYFLPSRRLDSAERVLPPAAPQWVRGQQTVAGPGGKPPEENLRGVQDYGETEISCIDSLTNKVVLQILTVPAQYLTAYFTFWQTSITQVDSILGMLLLVVQLIQLTCACAGCLPNRHKICFNPFETDWEKIH